MKKGREAVRHCYTKGRLLAPSYYPSCAWGTEPDFAVHTAVLMPLLCPDSLGMTELAEAFRRMVSAEPPFPGAIVHRPFAPTPDQTVEIHRPNDAAVHSPSKEFLDSLNDEPFPDDELHDVPVKQDGFTGKQVFPGAEENDPRQCPLPADFPPDVLTLPAFPEGFPHRPEGKSE